jgi:hypothetical protein
MRDEGQQSFRQLLRALSGAGITRVSIVTTNPLTKLQLVRLVAESRTQSSIEWVVGTNPLGRGA